MSLGASKPTSPTVNQIPPEFFLCPISLELMKDPVILSSGHTYDRRSIVNWFKTGKETCPQSRQRVTANEMIPNLTLRDCIRDWQAASDSIHDMKNPSSSTLISELHVKIMVENLTVETETLHTLKRLRIVAEADDRNRKLICDGGVLPILGSMLSGSSPENEEVCVETACEFEALGALATLSINEKAKRTLPAVGLSILPSLSWFLRKGTAAAKVNAARIIECMVVDDDSLLQLGAQEGLIQGLVEMLQDKQHLQMTSCACLRSLYAISFPKRNRRVAIEVGAVAAVIDLLPIAKEEVVEGALAFLDLISNRCTEGLVALSEHSPAIPILVRSIFKYTNSATEHAVSVLHAILMSNLKPLLHVEAVKAGAIAKLLLVIQTSGSNSEKKLKAQQVLKSLQVSSSDQFINTIRLDMELNNDDQICYPSETLLSSTATMLITMHMHILVGNSSTLRRECDTRVLRMRKHLRFCDGLSMGRRRAIWTLPDHEMTIFDFALQVPVCLMAQNYCCTGVDGHCQTRFCGKKESYMDTSCS